MLSSQDIVQKVSICYQKTDSAIYHSHRDLIRFWERMLRKTNIPVRMTSGFNPHPRMIFLHALGIGITSLHEELEVELNQKVDKEVILATLKLACNNILPIISVIDLPLSKKGRTMLDCTYIFSGFSCEQENINNVINNILLKQEINILRRNKTEEKNVEIRQYIKDLIFEPDKQVVTCTVLNSQRGTAKASEILELITAPLHIDSNTINIIKTSMTLSNN